MFRPRSKSPAKHGGMPENRGGKSAIFIWTSHFRAFRVPSLVSFGIVWATTAVRLPYGHPKRCFTALFPEKGIGACPPPAKRPRSRGVDRAFPLYWFQTRKDGHLPNYLSHPTEKEHARSNGAAFLHGRQRTWHTAKVASITPRVQGGSVRRVLCFLRAVPFYSDSDKKGIISGYNCVFEKKGNNTATNRFSSRRLTPESRALELATRRGNDGP